MLFFSFINGKSSTTFRAFKFRWLYSYIGAAKGKSRQEAKRQECRHEFFHSQYLLGGVFDAIFKNITNPTTKKACPQVQRSEPVSKVPVQKSHRFLPCQFALLGVDEIKDMPGSGHHEKIAAFPG
jgi:hypothetical protein